MVFATHMRSLTLREPVTRSSTGSRGPIRLMGVGRAPSSRSRAGPASRPFADPRGGLIVVRVPRPPDAQRRVARHDDAAHLAAGECRDPRRLLPTYAVGGGPSGRGSVRGV